MTTAHAHPYGLGSPTLTVVAAAELVARGKPLRGHRAMIPVDTGYARDFRVASVRPETGQVPGDDREHVLVFREAEWYAYAADGTRPPNAKWIPVELVWIEV